MIGGRRSLQGRKPGDRRVRIERPHSPYFRYTGRGQLTAREAASAPTTPAGKVWASIRGFFVGRPLMSEDELGERLSKKKALAIFSSDAISSSAYATEEILRVLILGGAAAMAFGLEAADTMRARWERQLPDVLLVIVESPFRAVISPVVAYLDILDMAWPPDKEAPLTIVVLPEYVARRCGIDCCITRPPSGSRPRSSDANARSSRTSHTDAVTDRHPPPAVESERN